MKKLYLVFVSTFILLNPNFALDTDKVYSLYKVHTDTSKNKPAKTTDTRTDKPALEAGAVATPLKTGSKIQSPPSKQEDEDKLISDVKVFPNPVEDAINLSFNVNKDSNVTIKIMDVLGNEIATLLSKKINAGEHTDTFDITSKLNSGFYFIRVVAGSESIIKRISVL